MLTTYHSYSLQCTVYKPRRFMLHLQSSYEGEKKRATKNSNQGFLQVFASFFGGGGGGNWVHFFFFLGGGGSSQFNVHPVPAINDWCMFTLFHQPCKPLYVSTCIR